MHADIAIEIGNREEKEMIRQDLGMASDILENLGIKDTVSSVALLHPGQNRFHILGLRQYT